jgi:hypothetical protein
MKMKTNMRAVVILSVIALTIPWVQADDGTDEQEAEQAVVGANQGQAEAKIVEKFSGLAGDDTETLVDSLRTGSSIDYVVQVEVPVVDDEGNPVMVEVQNEDGSVSLVQKTEIVDQTITAENTVGAMGYGGVVLSLGLAQATLPEGAEYKEIVEALFDAETGEGILDMRASKMGWGQIYAAYDLKVGEVMRQVHSARPDKPERAMKPEKAEKPVKPERPVKPEKPVKPSKPVKP